MGPEEQIRVLCALILLCVLVFAPAEFLSIFGHDSTAGSAIVPLPDPRRSPVASVPGLSTNYASLYLGAAVVSMEPSSCDGGSALISDSVDKYVLCPCDAPRKQFVVQLIRDVEVRSVMLRNAEHFSSGVRNFTLLGSRQYPTSTWAVLGHFEADQRRGRQYFDVAPSRPVRYIKLQWATSHGAEPWCTITSFQVYGIDMLDTLTRYEDDDSAGRLTGAEATAASQGGDSSRPPPITSTPEDAASYFKNGAAQVSGVHIALDSTGEFTTGKWDGTTASDRAVKRAGIDDFLFVPAEISLPAGAGEKLHVSPNYLKNRMTAPAFPWQGCEDVRSIYRNGSWHCPVSDRVELGFPCSWATCSASDGPKATPSTTASASPVSAANDEGLSTIKHLYEGLGSSRLAQLLRQQRSIQQELASLIQKEKDMAQEHNRTRAFLLELYGKYKEIAKESSEYRDRFRGLQLKYELLHERFLLRQQGGCGSVREGCDVDGKTYSGTQYNVAMTLAAFAFLALAITLMILSCTSPQRLSGPPSGWGRRYTLSGGGTGGGPFFTQRHQRGRGRLMSDAR